MHEVRNCVTKLLKFILGTAEESKSNILNYVWHCYVVFITFLPVVVMDGALLVAYCKAWGGNWTVVVVVVVVVVGGREGGQLAYMVVYMDVRKIWGGFFDSNYKYGCDILAKIINMDLKIVIFTLKNIDLGAKFGKN